MLCYFETLCTDSNAANSLINSSLTILFIRMMRNARAPTLRIRLANVLGLLIRHATYISEELAQTSVIEVLTEALKVRVARETGKEDVARAVMPCNVIGVALWVLYAEKGLTSGRARGRGSRNRASDWQECRLLSCTFKHESNVEWKLLLSDCLCTAG